MAVLSYSRAIGQALGDAMAADPSVILIGEDIGEAGGPFGVTRGLRDTFGEARVLDAPISEAAMVGAAVGAAMHGLKPVVEIMFMDFATLAMDAIVNQAAKARFMFGGQRSLPMVIRMPHGGGISAGPQHSQCLEAWFAHVPGLKVVCPSDASSAYALLRAAIADPDPVIFVEQKARYGTKSDLADDRPTARIGEARTLRSGRDATVVTYGSIVEKALVAADQLSADGVSVEVIDLQSIQPWDTRAVLDSVSRTHRIVIAHEATRAFGVGAEIAAFVGEHAFDELDAPVVRVGAPFMPVPFSKPMEQEFAPGAADISDAVRKVME